MVDPLYVSDLLLRVIRIGVKACIDVTLYAKLFITSIIKKHVLFTPRTIFDRCPMIHSWIILVPLDWLMARHTLGLVHNIAYFIEPMAEAYGMTFILFLFSSMVVFWVLLNFTPCNTGKNSFFDCSILNYFKNVVKVCTPWKILSSVLIYLYRSWCPICKQLHRGLSLKNSFQTLLYAFQKILHHFQSTICHSYILIRKAVVLPITFL